MLYTDLFASQRLGSTTNHCQNLPKTYHPPSPRQHPYNNIIGYRVLQNLLHILQQYQKPY